MTKIVDERDEDESILADPHYRCMLHGRCFCASAQDEPAFYASH